ncbi:hypothetical protein [Spirosoma sp.]|uniref:hypothetical protein n=1 Tax=Spirosoma sp. TaxID=1899569 RepID=UPI0026372F55|nr:hypothetical protein [Spirosoma sp.]MCX6212787.1 hypothetical protein [Spirosoma sp.]
MLTQSLTHLVNITLQLVNTLSLPLLHKATNEEKQEENYESNYHRSHSFLPVNRI